jgi:holliday junction DNA helicase RuvA
LPRSTDIEHDLVSEVFEILRSLGHSESDARRLMDDALSRNKKYKDVETLLHAVYEQRQN